MLLLLQNTYKVFQSYTMQFIMFPTTSAPVPCSAMHLLKGLLSIAFSFHLFYPLEIFLTPTMLIQIANILTESIHSLRYLSGTQIDRQRVSCFRNITVNCWTWFCNTKTEDKNLDKIELNAVEHGYPHAGCFKILFESNQRCCSSISCVWLFCEPMDCSTIEASLSSLFRNLLTFMSIDLMMLSKHLIPVAHFSGFSAYGFSRQER